MYYRVLRDAGGYHVGDVLDLGDAELATQIGQLVPLLKLAGRPEPEATSSEPSTPIIAPVTPERSKAPLKRHKRA
jgi:hypothetical protein